MSEQENNKDPLERLFREKAEEYDIEYNENDWLKLKERLDETDRQRINTIRRRWIAAAVILAFAFLTYFTVENQMQINRLNEKLSKYQSAEQEQPTQVREGDQIDNEDENPGTNQNTPTGKADKSKQANRNLAAVKDTADNNRSGAKSDEPQTVRSADKNIAPTKLQTIAAAPDLVDEPKQLAALSDLHVPETNPARATGRPAATGDETEAIASAARPSDPQPFTRMSLGFVMGPDLSTTGSLSNFHEPGYEFGITVDYNLTPKLGLSSGIIRSRVRYTASGSDYNPPGGFWSYGSTPQQTIGDCVLLDIPLYLKYDFLHFGESRLYARAGISSYIMLNEAYRFDYGYNNPPNPVQEWSDKTGTRHWMSNAGLSVGYEYDIRRNWSVRAEPYLKIPIQKVGWGNVKLYSMGMTFSLNYKL